MIKIPKYKSLSTSDIKGRGTVYIVENDSRSIRRTDLLGQEVYIDDKKYKVIGVESKGIMGGLMMSLLVGKEIIPEEDMVHKVSILFKNEETAERFRNLIEKTLNEFKDEEERNNTISKVIREK